jgi:hypothetical protein
MRLLSFIHLTTLIWYTLFLHFFPFLIFTLLPWCLQLLWPFLILQFTTLNAVTPFLYFLLLFLFIQSG